MENHEITEDEGKLMPRYLTWIVSKGGSMISIDTKGYVLLILEFPRLLKRNRNYL